MKGERPPWLRAHGPGRQPAGMGRRPDAVSPPGSPQGSPVPATPPPPRPLRSVEVGCAREAQGTPEAPSNRSHHNDAAICPGGESHLWTDSAVWVGVWVWVGGGDTFVTQTKPRVNLGVWGVTVHFGPREVLVFSNAPACLPVGLELGEGFADLRSKGQNKAVGSTHPDLFWGSESS